MASTKARITHSLHQPGSGGLVAAIRRFMTLRRQRAGLARLDEHLLADIGIDRAQAEAEAARPFWDAPASWRG